MRKKTKKRFEDLIVNSAASIIVGLVFVVGGFIAVLYLMARLRVFGPSLLGTLLIAAVLAVGIGIVGPVVYRKQRDRGRGSLKDVKELTRAQEARKHQNMR